MSEEQVAHDAALVQGSPAWHAARLGRFTASRLDDLMAKGQGKTRASYLLELAAERLSGVPGGSFEGNSDTEFGIEYEPKARRAYETRYGVFVEPIGFVVHPAMPYAGASPDGKATAAKGLELKCHRKPFTFLKHIEGEIPRGHLYQCQFGMSCTGLKEWDYGNFCPFMPEHMWLHVRTVARDEKIIAELVVAIREAEIEVAAKVAQYAKK